MMLQLWISSLTLKGLVGRVGDHYTIDLLRNCSVLEDLRLRQLKERSFSHFGNY